MKRTISIIAYLYLVWGCVKRLDRPAAWVLNKNQDRIYNKINKLLYGDRPARPNRIRYDR